MKSFQALSLRICDQRNADPNVDDAPELAPLLGRLSVQESVSDSQRQAFAAGPSLSAAKNFAFA